MRSIVFPVLAAAALALSGPSLAQSQASGTASQSKSPAVSETAPQQGDSAASTRSNNLLTINKLKQDLQKAGFTDIKVLADSFVVQANDKDGNPTVMTLSPGGVFAISEITQGSKQAKAGASPGSEKQMQHQ